MDDSAAFEKYEGRQLLCKKEIQLLRNYASRQLVAWIPNRDFYQSVYDESNNLYIVTEQRKRPKLCAVAEKGEKVVGNIIKKF